MIIFDMIDKVIESELLTPRQDILLLIALNLLILGIVISIAKQKYRETGDFGGAIEFEKYYRRLMNNSKWMTCLGIISIIPALRIVLVFFNTPVAFVPQCLFLLVTVIYVNYKIYKLLSPKSI